MKQRFLCLAAALLMLLTACNAQDTEPTLQVTLPQTGVVDFATWYRISHIYVGITRIAELV